MEFRVQQRLRGHSNSLSLAILCNRDHWLKDSVYLYKVQAGRASVSAGDTCDKTVAVQESEISRRFVMRANKHQRAKKHFMVIKL